MKTKTYAIIEIGGKQLFIKKNYFYDINHINSQIGSIISLNKILLIQRNKLILIGKPYLKSVIIEAEILKHFQEKKILVLKMKRKKKQKRKQGYRNKLTRIFISNILLTNTFH
uniref:Large ribosomal subunit protein bL21c n=1 Tax=Pterocladiophila hemisphaerica TaxID=2712948 RepID=A0A6M3WW44_9FLOR|nr:ribosomal protein L21 [Pterocladiophila hemisphaerica]